MTQSWRRLGGATMLCRAGHVRRNGLDSARFKLMSQHSNLRFVPLGEDPTVSNQPAHLLFFFISIIWGYALLLHLELRLLQLVDLLSNHLHLL